MSNNTQFTRIGGGVVTKLNTPSSAKSSQKNIFKPLIASSLALALGVSVASAAAPTVQYGIGSSANTPFSLTGEVQWGSLTDGYFGLTSATLSDTPVDLTFQFVNNTSQPSGSLSGEVYTIQAGGTISSVGQTPILLLQSTSGINMQGKTLTFDFYDTRNNGTTGQDARKMKLDLSNVDTTNAFIGNIVIKGGRASGNGAWYGENQFEAAFGGNMIGNITIQKGTYDDISSSLVFKGDLIGNIDISEVPPRNMAQTDKKTRSIFTFDADSDQKIKGNITSTGSWADFNFSGNGDKTIIGEINSFGKPYGWGGNNFIFNSTGTNTITGDIIATPHGSAQGNNTIVFNAGTNIINGNIITNWNYAGTTYNTIKAEKSSQSLTINGQIKTNASDGNRITLSVGNNTINNAGTAIYALGGSNEINFTGSTTAGINGGIKAETTSSSVPGTNTITLGATSSNTIVGDITATYYGSIGSINKIYFTNGTENKITGTITAISNVSKNIIESNADSKGLTINGQVFAREGKNTITLSTGNNEISGIQNAGDVIKALGGTNTITLSGAMSAINGNIVAETTASNLVGANDITLSATSSNTIIGNITANYYGSYGSTNNIDFTNGSNNEITGVVTAIGSVSKNIIESNVDSKGLTINGQVFAREGKNTITLSTGNNEISSSSIENAEYAIKALGGANTITLSGTTSAINGNIVAETTASEVIGTNNITLSATSTNSIGGEISASKYNSYTSSNQISFTSGSTNTITGSISATGGNNTISFSTGNNTINGNLTASGGNNTITANGSASVLAISGAISSSSGSNTITSSAANTFASVLSTGGTNLVVLNGANSQANKIQGDITASGGKNIIAIERTGSSNTFQTSANGAIALTAKGSGVAVGQNIIGIKDAAATNTLNFSSISLYNDNNNNSTNQYAQNILSLDGTTTLTVGSISTTTAGRNSNNNNKNIIAKDILTGNTASNVGINGALTTNNYLDDTHAFIGKLTVSAGVSALKGQNIVSFKANSTQNTSVISNLVDSPASTRTLALGDAISGANTIYLNVADSRIGSGVKAISGYITALSTNTDATTAQQTLLNSSVVVGNIVNSGTTNIKIKGTANTTVKTAEDKAQIGILGNISNNSGTLNVVLEDTFFAPSELIVTTQSQPNQQTDYKNAILGDKFAGNITTAEGATTNIVTRFTNPVVKTTGISMYNIDARQGSTTNVVIQGNVDLGTHIDYAKGSAVNLIFANANDSASDNFEGEQNNLAGNGSQLLGVTYQDGVKLAIADKTVMIGDNPSASFLETYSSYYTDGSKPLATVWANRTADKDIVGIEGLVVGDIYSLDSSTGGIVTSKTYDVTLKSGSAFAGKIKLDPSTTSAINIVMEENSKLILSDTDDISATDTFIISSLNITAGTVDQYQLQMETLKQTNNVINLASGGASANNVAERENFRLLTIGNATGVNIPAKTGGLSGDGQAVFMTYVNTNADQNIATLGKVASSGKKSVRAGGGSNDGQYGNIYSDRIIIANIGANTKAQSGDYYMQFAVDAHSKLGSVTYNASNDSGTGKGGTKTAGNIAVLTVVNTDDKIANPDAVNGKAGINLKTQDVLQGFDQIGGDLVAVQTDINGVYDENGAYTTYFINNLVTRGATEATQEVTASAFATNYDLYLANFNSLNKRMGELRDNDNSQGAWARVFSGAQTNDFSKSKSTYTTIQGGYDYAFGMEGANNYLGLAVAYSMSSSKSDLNAIDINGSTKGIEDIKSSAVEVAVYNSYVQDEGWYNDSIFKFSYIMSDFTMIGQSSTYSTNNMAFTLSDEFGYRFKLGEAKEWYIDPQLELAFGYFNQSDFVQTLGLSSLDGVAESIYTTRARLGSSFGYDFKKFTENKPIKASVYVGAFYEYDYVAGGDVTLTTNLGGETVSSSAISSDGRVVMNVGTNMTIKDNTRIYFDFETSFAGKIRTDYQVNVGVRYSFGENTGYTPLDPNKKSITPLKVSDENAEASEEDTQEEKVNSEVKGEEKTQEQTAEQNNTSSTEDKAEEKTDSKSEGEAQ